MRTRLIAGLALLAALLVLDVPTASAQILIWSLPKEDGAWVRFEGTYKQNRTRTNDNELLEWQSVLTISSVGSETAEFSDVDDSGNKRVRQVPCRWVEFKSLTKPNGLDKPPGPGDTFVYKVLIPEERVTGENVDQRGIPVAFLPIIKGWRKIGQRDVESVAEKALAVYPTISLVTYYPDLKAEGEGKEELQIAGENVTARLFRGTRSMQQTTQRSKNAASLWRSDGVPFGLARFQVTLTLENKDLTASADEFKQSSLIEVEMTAVATGTDARSELGDGNAEK